jgi:4-hydroxy-tetrahydrodipicolinate synthase
MLGIEVGGLRLPMVEADEEQRAIVREALEAQGLLEHSTV